MKKVIASIIIAVFLATALCGCGNYGDARDNGTYSSVETPVATATITPDMSMDEDDGIVTDRDGIIENDDTAGGTSGTSGTSGSTGNAGGTGSTGGSGSTGSSSSAGSAGGNGGSGSASSGTSGSGNGGSAKSSPSVSSGNGNS